MSILDSIRTTMSRPRSAFITLGLSLALAGATAAYRVYPWQDPVRAEAWERARPMIEEVATGTRTAAADAAFPVQDFLRERRARARDFATELLSLAGKWEYVKGSLGAGDHALYMQECFARHIFRPEELQAVLESSVGRYVGVAEGLENRLLLELRADLADGAMAAPGYLPSLASEAEFRERFDETLAAIAPVVAADLGADLGKEVVSMVGLQVASRIVAEIGTALAAELGVSGGLLGTGTLSGPASWGIGIAAAILADQLLTWAMEQVGYDPAGAIAARVEQALLHLERQILDGPTAADFPDFDPTYDPLWDPEFEVIVPTYRGPLPDEESFKALFNRFRAAEVRMDIARAAHNAPGTLGLKNKLRRFDEARSALREAALRRLILEGGDM